MPISRTVIILWILVFFLLVIIIILIAWNSVIKANLILPENCKTIGEIGVLTNKQITVLNTCGQNKNEQCSFLNIPTLQDAIGKCYLNDCLAFTYSESTNQMTIVDQTKLINGGVHNVYITKV